MAPYTTALILLLSLVKQHVQAYIPAVATNSTETAIEGGLNLTETSKLNMQWYSRGYVRCGRVAPYLIVHKVV
jgi:hypothetical protein